MKQKRYKYFSIILVIMMLLLPIWNCTKVLANSVGAIASNNGNGTYTVGVGSSLTGAVTVTTSTGGSVKFWCEAGGCSPQGNATFSGSGSVTVTASPSNPMDDGNGNKVTATGSSVVVNVTSPTAETPGGGGTATPPADNNTTTDPAKEENEEDNKDKDGTNTLASLEVSVGKLSPAFDANTTTYDVSLPAGTTKITLNATAASDKATVEGVGEKDVNTGDNAFEIICRAENGTTTTYTIRVNVSEKPVTTLKYGKTTLGVLSGGAVAGNLFEEQKIKVNGKEVSAWVNTKLNITLLYMQNEKTGEKDLYMYDVKKNEITSIHRPFAYVGKNLVMIDVPKELQERKGMKFTTVTLGDYKLPGWTFTDKAFENYMVIYVMDDAGNTVYYQYDKKENTLQLFSQAAALTQKDYEAMSQSKDNNMLYYIVIGILGVGCVVFCITTIRFYRKRNTAKYRKIEVNGNSMSAEAKSLLHEDN